METRKKGISLIVLIITIIVMIILAAAIILSISNSGIMDKANKAKKDSDAANLKEYVNVLQAEWELMDTDERSSSEYASKEAYVNGKLEDKGYTGALLMNDGTFYTNLQVNAKKALQAGIQIGDTVDYTLDNSTEKKSYTTSGKENTAPNYTETGPTSQTVERIEYTNSTWKYIGIGENGEILIAPDMVSSVTDEQNIKLSGKGGFVNGPQELNDMCAAMYSTDKGTARSINIDDITSLLDYTGDKGMYYDASKNPVITKAAKKISELEKELDTPLSYRTTPTGSGDIGEYYSDAYKIERVSTDILKSASDTLKTKLINFVFDGYGYHLASTCSYVYFSGSNVFFLGRWVRASIVDIMLFFSSKEDNSQYLNCPARPVVSLNSDVQLTTPKEGVWLTD